MLLKRLETIKSVEEDARRRNDPTLAVDHKRVEIMRGKRFNFYLATIDGKQENLISLFSLSS